MRFPIKTALLLAALALLPVTGARADTIESANVHLRLRGALSRQLEEQGVRLIGLKAGFAGHQAVSLRISSGEIEGRGGSGYLYLEGGFRLQAGKRSVTVRRLLLNTSEGFLTGVVDGTKVKLASLPPQQALIGIFNVEVVLRSLKLTPTGEARSAPLPAALSPELAQALNELFGAPKGKPDHFRAGEPFGSVTFTALTR